MDIESDIFESYVGEYLVYDFNLYQSISNEDKEIIKIFFYNVDNNYRIHYKYSDFYIFLMLNKELILNRLNDDHYVYKNPLNF